MANYRTPIIDEFVNGFIYQAFIGYAWLTVEYPKNGISHYQLQSAIDNKTVRVCDAKIYQTGDIKKGDTIYMTFKDGSPDLSNPLIVSKINEDKRSWVMAKKKGSKDIMHLQDGEFIKSNDT